MYKSLLKIIIHLCVTMCLPISLYAQRVALSKDNPTLNYSNGIQQIQLGNYSRGMGLLKLAAGKGHVEAECMLGDIYLEGKITSQDFDEAGYWYSEAVKHGSNKASERLSQLIAEGKYTIKDKHSQNNIQPVQIIHYNVPTSGLDNKSNVQRTSHMSDVDNNIPQINIINKGSIVIIIANEHYQEEANVDYANNDGKVFKDYCVQTLGIPENQVKFYKDATLNNMIGAFDWLQEIMETEMFKHKTSVIFYYAGHGVPDEASGATFLLPVDGKGNKASTGYSLNSLYGLLNKLPAKHVSVFIDACFSGSQRGAGMLMSARGVRIKTKTDLPIGNVTIFSAATNDETAYPYKEQEHGLFTYYLLKKLQETRGECSFGELSDYISEHVQSMSLLENGKSQTPTVTSGEKEWRNNKFK